MTAALLALCACGAAVPAVLESGTPPETSVSPSAEASETPTPEPTDAPTPTPPVTPEPTEEPTPSPEHGAGLAASLVGGIAAHAL